ncbi:MAG: AAA family ATPase [Candidatus Aenigmarchaeota archaeon]|nr:AAA family ATPase [Candidatus Aenigmarchaeota archaeon]
MLSYFSAALQNIVRLPYEKASEDGVKYLAVIGPVGAGKTYVSRHLCDEAEKMHIPASYLGFDSYLRLSSSERKRMLQEADASQNPELVALATNQLEWYDFVALNRDLSQLKEGSHIHRQSVYSKETGELDAVLDVSTQDLLARSNGTAPLLVIDGTYLLHDGLRNLFDAVVFLYANDEVRLERLRRRDSHRRTPKEIKRQFIIAYESQMPYFRLYCESVDAVALNNERFELISANVKDLL